MHWKFAATTAAAVAFFASPASAADYRHCWTQVSDSNGITKYMVVTEIFDAEPHPDFERIWTEWSVPIAENALKSSGATGRVKASCTTYAPDALQHLQTNRPKIFEALRRKGVKIDIIKPNFGAAKGSAHTADTATGSNSSKSANSQSANRNSNANESQSSSGKGANTDRDKPHHVRVANVPPPSGYSGWRQLGSYDYPPYTNVYWAQKVSKDEVRIVWQCVNESSVDVACSVGAGKNKTYHCELPGMRTESTGSLGERATVRAGTSHTFPSDWACRGLGATGVRPDVQVKITPL